MKKFLFILTFLLAGWNGYAWVFPEHRDITRTAVERLDPQHRALLDALWTAARKGHEARLFPGVMEDQQGLHPEQLDFVTWPAIGGDHSASPDDMLRIILHSEWIMKVASIGAQLGEGIATARNESERINRLRDSDIRLLRADPDYIARAGNNFGHFLMALPNVDIGAAAYFDSCCKPGAPLNIVGIYTWFHNSALIKAKRLASPGLTPEQRSSIALSMLADEAFALHFLEDNFAAGHVAGIWGDASQRKGTHDYYNEAGLQVTTWNGRKIILTGDAYIRPQDIDEAADAVLISLTQVLDAAAGNDLKEDVVEDVDVMMPDTLNVSLAKVHIYRLVSPAIDYRCNQVLAGTPAPGLATGLGALPRINAELGPFIGIAPALHVHFHDGGFGTRQRSTGVIPGLEMALRVGLGMDGVVNESGDGLAFLDLGWRLESSSSISIEDDPELKQFGSYMTAIPGRDAWYMRLRLPFFLLPGDLLVAAPVLLLSSPATLNKMIVTAGNGGLLPWQSGITTPIGRFQFILGREVGVCMYGTGEGPDHMILGKKGVQDEQTLITMYSTQLEFPVVEYRFLRIYGARQGANMKLQLHAGLDIPGKRKVILDEGDPFPPVKSIWYGGFRLVFDWRHYLLLGKK